MKCICKKCGVEKQLDDFQLDKRRNKHYTTCRACRVRASRESRRVNAEKNRERAAAYAREWRAKNPEKAAAILKKWQDKNIEHCREYRRKYTAEWRAKNPGKEWKNTNPEAAKASAKKSALAWRQRNPNYQHEHYLLNKAKYVANRARRRAIQDAATPNWLTMIDKAQIASFYEVAKAIEMQTGIKHHVDHIVPINGRDVSGMHVPWNLQVITATENLSKGWRF